MHLTGEFFPTIDANGRLAFPAKLREGLGERFYITLINEPFLVAMSEEEFELLGEKIQNLPPEEASDMRRRVYPNAYLVEPDRQGRVSIPSTIRERSGVTNEVAVIGNWNRAEIWDKDTWTREQEVLADKSRSAEHKKVNL